MSTAKTGFGRSLTSSLSARRSLASLTVWTTVLLALSLVPRSRADVDRTTVLSLGRHLVSSYQVDKNYQRFLDSASQAAGRQPSSDETRAWFTRFLSQQILIGHALEEGFGERPEVQTELLHMERNMLTQLRGPFYDQLLREETGGFDPKEAYQQSKKIVSVEVIRVPLSAPCANDLAIGRLSLTALDGARKSGVAFYYKGDLAWPYLGFEDLAAVLESVNEPKSWWQLESTGLRVVARVIAVKAQMIPPFDQAEARLKTMGEEAQRQLLRTKRAEAILANDRFRFDWAGLQALLGTNKINAAEIDESAVAALRNRALATIKADGTTAVVTIADYVAYHNALYVKGIPRTPLDVFYEVRDLIVANRDYRDAAKIPSVDNTSSRVDCGELGEILFDGLTLAGFLGASGAEGEVSI